MRRIFDILFSSVALILLLPLLIAIAVAIMCDSPGNPLYGGRRAGRRGVPFRMWKFRTMVPGADRIGPGITAGRDARVTRLGWFLRRAKLDELPQFVNALAGDMSIVGPRAEVPSIVERYTPLQREVLEYKPGITGVGAIHYTTTQMHTLPEGVSPEEYYIANLLTEKVQLEIQYERSRTLVADLRIVFLTVCLILNPNGLTISNRRIKP